MVIVTPWSLVAIIRFMSYTNFVLYSGSRHFYPMCTLTAVFVLTVYPADSAVQLSADIPSGVLARTRAP
jgi:hypothetical protein